MLRNLVALSSGQLITWASSALLVVVMPRYLGGEGYGKFALALFMVTVLTLLTDLGCTPYLTKEIARNGWSRSIASQPFNALLLRLPLVFTACFLGVVAVHLLGYDSETRNVFYVLLPTVALQAFARILSAAFMGVQDMKPMAWTTALGRIVYTSIVVVLLISGAGLVETAAVSNISPLVALVAIAVYALRRLNLRADFDLRVCKAVFFGGLPFLLWQASLLVYGQVDILQLSLMENDSVVGWYATAYQIALMPAFIPTIVMMVLYPLLSKLAEGDREAFADVTRRGVSIMMVTMTPIAAGTAVLSPAIIHLLGYPSEFDNSIPLISILALHIPSAAVGTILGASLNALDRQRRWAVVGLTAAVVNPALNLAAIPLASRAFDNGAIGAAITTDITEAFMLCSALVLLPSGMLGREQLRYSALCLVAAGIMAASVWLVRDAGIFFAVPLGGVVYVTASLALKTLRVSDAVEAFALLRKRATQPAGVT